jgi:hypothetical protein
MTQSRMQRIEKDMQHRGKEVFADWIRPLGPSIPNKYQGTF